MRELPDDIIKNYSKFKLLNLEKNLVNYIVDFKLEDISWRSLTKEEMEIFLLDNYCVDNNYHTWDNGSILGMHYLQWYLYTDKYFIGTVKNNIGKETIVGCISYFNYHKIYGNVNYVSTVEINYFYQGMGLSKIMYEKFVNEIDFNKDIMLTTESLIGRKCHVMGNFKKVLKKNNFDKKIIIDD